MLPLMPKGYITQPGSGSSNTKESIQFVDITITYRVPLVISPSNKSQITGVDKAVIKAEFAAQLLISLGLFPSHLQPRIINTSLVHESTGTNDNIIEPEKPSSHNQNKIFTDTDGGYSDVNAGLTTSSSSTQPQIIKTSPSHSDTNCTNTDIPEQQKSQSVHPIQISAVTDDDRSDPSLIISQIRSSIQPLVIKTSLIHSDIPNCTNTDIQEQQQSPSANRNQISAVTADGRSDTSFKLSQNSSSAQPRIIRTSQIHSDAFNCTNTDILEQQQSPASRNQISAVTGNAMKLSKEQPPGTLFIITDGGIKAWLPNAGSTIPMMEQQSDSSVQQKQLDIVENKISSSSTPLIYVKRKITSSTPLKTGTHMPKHSLQNNLVGPNTLITVDQGSLPKPIEVVDKRASIENVNKERKHLEDRSNPAKMRHAVSILTPPYKSITSQKHKLTVGSEQVDTQNTNTVNRALLSKLHRAQNTVTSTTLSSPKISSPTVITGHMITEKSPFPHSNHVTVDSIPMPFTPALVHSATSNIKTVSTHQFPVQITPCSIQLTKPASASAPAEDTASSKGSASKSFFPTSDIKVSELKPSTSLCLSSLVENSEQENSVHNEADIRTSTSEILNMVKLETSDECSWQTKPSGSCNHSTHSQTSTRVTTFNCVSCLNHREKPRRVKIPSNRKPFKCDHCPARYLQIVTLTKHTLKKHKGEELRCDKCKYMSPSKAVLLLHHKEKHKVFKCKKCDHKSTTKRDRQKHVEKYHPKVKKFECDQCKVRFARVAPLRAHMRVHAAPKVNKCDECARTFSRSEHLKRHLLMHTGVKPFVCDFCDAPFTRQDNLQKHIRQIHTAERPHQCAVCEKKFSSTTEMKQHMLIHTGAKPHKCELCQKGFRVSQSLKLHMRIHTGEKPYKCEWCEKGFAQSTALKQHVLQHTGEKPHKCGVCERGFTASATLKQHMLTHTGEKPHKCGLCENSYRSSGSLKYHLTIHEAGHAEARRWSKKELGLVEETIQDNCIPNGENLKILCEKLPQRSSRQVLSRCYDLLKKRKQLESEDNGCEEDL